jgi:hypothetical protein
MSDRGGYDLGATRGLATADIGANGQASIVRLQPSGLAFFCPASCDICHPLPDEAGGERCRKVGISGSMRSIVFGYGDHSYLEAGLESAGS